MKVEKSGNLCCVDYACKLVNERTRSTGYLIKLSQCYNLGFYPMEGVLAHCKNAFPNKDKNKEMALQKEGKERKVHKAECGDRVWLAAQQQGRGEAEGSGLESGESGCHSCKSSLPI